MELGGAVYKRLNLMKMLKEIDFVGHYDGMETAYFNDLVNMFGENLESLKITHLELKCRQINAKNGVPLVYPQIKKLELNGVCFSSDIGTFISRSFPHLHTLKFKECFKSEYYDTKKEGYFIMIPNVDLCHLQIIDTFGPDDYVIVVTLCDNKRRMYTTKSGKIIDRYAMENHFGLRDSAIFPPTVSMDYDKKPVTPIVTIICNSLKDIFLTGI
jgi:hypothetical protein